jgi:hypothetical protein
MEREVLRECRRRVDVDDVCRGWRTGGQGQAESGYGHTNELVMLHSLLHVQEIQGP